MSGRTDEPDCFEYRALKGNIYNTLDSAAPEAFARYEREGRLEQIVMERALRLWPSVQVRLKLGMSINEALLQLAPDIYPAEATFAAGGEDW